MRNLLNKAAEGEAAEDEAAEGEAPEGEAAAGEAPEGEAADGDAAAGEAAGESMKGPFGLVQHRTGSCSVADLPRRWPPPPPMAARKPDAHFDDDDTCLVSRLQPDFLAAPNTELAFFLVFPFFFPFSLVFLLLGRALCCVLLCFALFCVVLLCFAFLCFCDSGVSSCYAGCGKVHACITLRSLKQTKDSRNKNTKI